MRNVVIGTAGHIDHGKTALVKALTGLDTDLLKEEKETGISIVSGFAHFKLSNGQIAEIIDVPGHEKLIKNMYRGISGVDMALLVIAADDGPMPQTKEHLNILSLLEIKTGLVVITKTDLINDELLRLTKEEINKALIGSFLEDAPRVCVSNKTREGIDEVKIVIEQLAQEVGQRVEEKPFRLPVDRIFTATGHGRIVTGTIATGSIKAGVEVEIFPSGRKLRVKSVQVHKQRVKKAYAGQRVGLNLAGAGSESVKRGMVISDPSVLSPTYLINANLQYLPTNKQALTDRSKVRIHSGTSEAVARVVIMEGNEIQPGQNKYVQLRLDQALAPLPFDKYIIRSLSPVVTIGGGTILEIAHKKYRMTDQSAVAHLKVLETGSAVDLIEAAAKCNKCQSLNMTELLLQTGLTHKEALGAIEELKKKGKIAQLENGTFFHRESFAYIRKRIIGVVRSCYQKNPRQKNLPKNRVRNLIEESLSPYLFELVVRELANDNVLEVRKEGIRLAHSESKLTAKEQKIIKELDRICRNGGYKPIRFGELINALDFCREKDIELVLKFLLSEGKLIRLKDGSFMEAQKYMKAQKLIIDFIEDREKATVIQIKDLLQSGRRGAVSILEHLDSLKLTVRIDDYRILRQIPGRE